jgi:hypothetical protein
MSDSESHHCSSIIKAECQLTTTLATKPYAGTDCMPTVLLVTHPKHTTRTQQAAVFTSW